MKHLLFVLVIMNAAAGSAAAGSGSAAAGSAAGSAK
jgi:hypothetical protein